MPSLTKRVGRLFIFAFVFIILTVLVLTGIYKTDLGLKFAYTLPDSFWNFFRLFFRTTNAEENAELELFALASLSAVIAALLLVITSRLGRLLLRR